MYRFFGRFMRSINHTWQMFFVGLVFGIGFDTATEVVLLSATAGGRYRGACPGTPCSTHAAAVRRGHDASSTASTGCFMNFAYGWAFARPVRKVYYNLVITGLSIAAAFIIGTIEIIGVLTSELHLHGWFWDTVANFDINKAGIIMVGLFLVIWVIAVAVWKYGNVEHRWERAAEAARGVQGPLVARSPHCSTRIRTPPLRWGSLSYRSISDGGPGPRWWRPTRYQRKSPTKPTSSHGKWMSERSSRRGRHQSDEEDEGDQPSPTARVGRGFGRQRGEVVEQAGQVAPSSPPWPARAAP